jgi:hypothetical protein
MLRRGLLAVAVVFSAVAVGAAPAQAFVVGDNLTVVNYYSNATKTSLVGQSWTGCDRPRGSWGTTTSYTTLTQTPC